MHAELLQTCLILYNHLYYSLPGSSVHRILQARILEWVALVSSRVSSWSMYLTHISMSLALADGFFSISALHIYMSVAQSCPTLCNPMDCSPLGSSVHGVFQARILEQVAISFTRGSSQPRDWSQVSCIAGRFFTILAHMCIVSLIINILHQRVY